jgi:DNA polymerase bacteriophage-type
MNLLKDYESRSTVDLRKRNIYVYAADPSTEVLCCGLKIDDGFPSMWFPKLWDAGFREFPSRNFAGARAVKLVSSDDYEQMCADADEIHAHNAQFERVMHEYVLHQRQKFRPIPISKYRCSAARAAALALPRSLEQVGEVLGLRVQKDREGHRLMMKMCKPQPDGTYIEDVPNLIRLAQYCIQDVEAEYAVEQAIPALPPAEERIWQLDQKINDRGFGFDRDGALELKFAIEEAEVRLLKEVETLTAGAITSARQVAKLKAWLKEEEELDLADMQKSTVAAALKKLGDGRAKRMLELRQEMSLSSTAKINTALRLISDDNRIRGSLLYHGATTGRWGGKGFQPHNLPRDSYKDPQMVQDAINGFHLETTIKAASKCLRGLLVPQEGRVLCAVDYSAIEARVLAWLADEQTALDVFRKNLDPYKVVAQSIFNVEYDQVTKAQRDQAKVPELACGFRGWIPAFNAMAKNLGIEPIPENRAKEIILLWRQNRPMTVELWDHLEEAAMATVRTGKAHRAGKIVFGLKGIFLYMKLPSGRLLAYPYPKIELRDTPYEKDKKTITFMGIDQYTRKWTRLYTYSGRLAENATSGVARDILCDGLIRLDEADFNLVLHVHDEGGAEEETNRLQEMMDTMLVPPTWAPDLPMGVSGWVGPRYKKD